MAVVVFECPLDQETLESIRDLRVLCLQVLRRQVAEIDTVIHKLKVQGALAEHEQDDYRDVILEDLSAQCEKLEGRLAMNETVFADELELYVDILAQR